MTTTFKFEGEKEVQRAIDELRKKAPEALGAGLYALGLKVMNTAKRNCPVDTGRTRASGFVASPTIKDGEPQVQCGFGTAYAPFIHEGTKYMAGRKFLSKAIEQESSGAKELIAKQAMKALEKGGGIALRSADIPKRPKK